MRFAFVLILSMLLSACSTTYQNKDVLGTTMPTMEGETLEKEKVEIPSLFDAPATLLLVGYKQDSQFDIDRWLIGLDMTQTKVNAYEIPAIQGMFPRMFKPFINNGMRAGIPKELWKGVITLYKDGEAMQKYTGNENGNNARVLLIDNKGKVKYFYDRGFSVEALNNVRKILESTAE
ncbi:MAG: hypothetical protein ACPGTQ_01585 [Colwellia sp.]